jgi:hypothetical protein
VNAAVNYCPECGVQVQPVEGLQSDPEGPENQSNSEQAYRSTVVEQANAVETKRKSSFRRWPFVAVALLLFIGIGASIVIGHQKPSNSVKQEEAQFRAKILHPFKRSFVTSNELKTIFLGPNDAWAYYTVSPKRADVLIGYAHYVNGKWLNVKGTGQIGQSCPKSMPLRTCRELNKLLTPSPLEDLKSNVESAESSVEELKTLTVGPIHWVTDQAHFTATGTGSSPVIFTFQFGLKKKFFTTQIRNIDFTAATNGNSIPFLEVPPNSQNPSSMIVTICIPNTTANMGTRLATTELPFLEDLQNQAFINGTIETANPNGTLNKIVDPNSLLECNGNLSYVNPTVP